MSTTVQTVSVLTCPACGASSEEQMPLDACAYFHECRGCGQVLKPTKGDCCVFCSFGTVPCPPVQAAAARLAAEPSRRARMNRPALAFSTTDTPPEDMLQAVDAGLEQYNYAVAPLSEVRPLAAFARQGSGEVVGGATGRTWGKCCELLQLWVAAEARSRGVGSRLLQEFEAHARTRGCTIFYLTTLSYQAPEFYRRRGYAVLAEIAGYPNGIVKYLMHKAA